MRRCGGAQGALSGHWLPSAKIWQGPAGQVSGEQMHHFRLAGPFVGDEQQIEHAAAGMNTTVSGLIRGLAASSSAGDHQDLGGMTLDHPENAMVNELHTSLAGRSPTMGFTPLPSTPSEVLGEG